VKATSTFEVMPVEVFEGGCGHLVIMQEWPSLTDGESYLRVMLDMRDAEVLCKKIMAVAGKARR
jgi:hypothetical protein